MATRQKIPVPIRHYLNPCLETSLHTSLILVGHVGALKESLHPTRRSPSPRTISHLTICRRAFLSGPAAYRHHLGHPYYRHTLRTQVIGLARL